MENEVFCLKNIMLTRKQKEELVKDLAEKFSKSTSVVFSDYTGLTVSDLRDLRKELNKEKGEYAIVKNTLIKLALDKSGLFAQASSKNLIKEKFTGPAAVGLGYGDETFIARTLYNFAKSHLQLKFKCGIVEGKLLQKEEIEELAKLPTKQELLAKVVGSIKAPISGFVNVLSGNFRSLLNVLNGIKEKAH